MDLSLRRQAPASNLSRLGGARCHGHLPARCGPGGANPRTPGDPGPTPSPFCMVPVALGAGGEVCSSALCTLITGQLFNDVFASLLL